jgi:hypothetical protein
MAPKLSPSEQLAHSTVRIECQLGNGQIGTGTGFFLIYFNYSSYGSIVHLALVCRRDIKRRGRA